MVQEGILSSDAPICFYPHTFDIQGGGSQVMRDLREAASAAGVEFSIVIFDTEGTFQLTHSDENDNMARRRHAQCLRNFTNLPGNPSVIALTHPAKAARGISAAELDPRGASSFKGEIDALAGISGSTDEGLVMQPNNVKWRGEKFEPVKFLLEKVKIGDELNTVIVKELTEGEAYLLDGGNAKKLRDLLKDVKEHPEASQRARAGRIKNMSQSDVNRKLQELAERGLIESDPLNKNSFTVTQYGHGALDATKQ